MNKLTLFIVYISITLCYEGLASPLALTINLDFYELILL